MHGCLLYRFTIALAGIHESKVWSYWLACLCVYHRVHLIRYISNAGGEGYIYTQVKREIYGTRVLLLQIKVHPEIQMIIGGGIEDKLQQDESDNQDTRIVP